VLLNFESLKNNQKFIVTYIIIQLCHSESARVKNNWMNFIVFIHNKKNYSKSIVGGISFHNELSIGDLVHKNRYRDKYFLQEVESITTEGVKLPGDVLSDETGQ